MERRWYLLLTTVSKYLFTSLVFFFRLVSAYVRNPIQINLSACAKAYFYLHTCAFNRKKKTRFIYLKYTQKWMFRKILFYCQFSCVLIHYRNVDNGTKI